MLDISPEFVQLVRNLSTSSDKKVLIVPHVNPDGDAIGSAMALYYYFSKFQIVNVISPSKFPVFLEWLPEIDKGLIYYEKKSQCEDIIASADYIFILDHNASDRSGDLETFIERSKAVRLMIDHHPNPSYPVDYSISFISVSSTAELVYELIHAVNPSAFNKNIASAIYTGIMTDTGNFMHNVHSSTFRIVSQLLSFGIDRDAIYDSVFNSYSFDRMRMIGYALHKKAILLRDISVVIISLNKKELKSYNFQMGDTEGLVNIPLASKEVKVSILVLEKEDGIRYSFRSKGNISINTIAKKYFFGGGHRNAAGGSDKFSVSLEQSIEKLKNILYQEKDLFIS